MRFYGEYLNRVRRIACNKICMTPSERERMEELCARIAVEKNHRKFLDLVKQLNHLLEQSHPKLRSADGDTEPTTV